MRILVSGASGFIGAPLVSLLRQKGHEVVPLTHSFSKDPHFIYWNPLLGQASKEVFEGFDAVIHLAGESVSIGRWSKKKKARIRTSREKGTQFLCQILSSLQSPPKIFISASATGYYGNRGEDILTESSPSGVGFLPDVCKSWESASSSLEQKGIRVVHARFGMVLGKGGILSKILPLYRFGFGAILGSGNQWISWIALPDLIQALVFALDTQVSGPLNLVSPEACRQKDFSKSLAQEFHKPCILRIPSFFLKWLLGTMAEELLLSSCHALPEKLVKGGYVFQYENLQEFLKSEFFL